MFVSQVLQIGAKRKKQSPKPYKAILCCPKRILKLKIKVENRAKMQHYMLPKFIVFPWNTLKFKNSQCKKTRSPMKQFVEMKRSCNINFGTGKKVKFSNLKISIFQFQFQRNFQV